MVCVNGVCMVGVNCVRVRRGCVDGVCVNGAAIACAGCVCVCVCVCECEGCVCVGLWMVCVRE